MQIYRKYPTNHHVTSWSPSLLDVPLSCIVPNEASEPSATRYTSRTPASDALHPAPASSTRMTAPRKPIQLLPYATYIHLSSSLAPETIQQEAAAHAIHIVHKGPVGELESEHVFEVLDGRRASIAGDSLVGRDVVESAVLRLKGTDGVKDAKVLEQKQRAKR